MYVGMLLTDWNVIKEDNVSADQDVYIGRSETAMWMRIVSSWVCMLLYIWSLVAPVVMPERCVQHSTGLAFFALKVASNQVWRSLSS